MKKLPSDYLRQGWCQNREAESADGNSVDPQSRYAVKWCIKGAFRRLGGCERPAMKTIRDVCGENYADYNDAPGRTQAEVVAVAEEVERRLGWRK